MKRWDIRCGDALRLLLDVESSSVDGVITDCPYSSGGATRGDRTGTTSTKYVQSDSGNKRLADFAGDNRDGRGFLYWSTLWYSETLRCTKDGGILLTFTDWRQLPSTTDAVQAGGWVWRGIMPWYKPAHRPQKGRPSAACEYIVFATKGPHKPYDGAPCVRGFYEQSPPQKRVHITQKPLELMEELVLLVPPGGVVLDPFLGSGTTAVAAVKRGRYPIGFELVSANVVEIESRLSSLGDGL